jgi:hypothetical protein
MVRLGAMQVELGWLSDARTFSYQLVAHPTAAGVEARGYVPNEAVKQHALAVARAHTPVPVLDQLKVHPNLVQRSGGGSPEELRDAAAASLVEAFPEQAGAFVVHARADGEVTVSGTVGSLEEKLAVSRRLRHVGACTCVANHLEVGTVARVARRRRAPAPVAVAPAPRAEPPATRSVAPAAQGAQAGSWELAEDRSWATRPAPAPVPAAPRVDPVPQPLPAIVTWEEPGQPAPPVAAPPARVPTTGATRAVSKPSPPLPPEAPVRAEAPAPHLEGEPTTGGYVASGVILCKSTGPEAAPRGPVAREAPATPRVAAAGQGVQPVSWQLAEDRSWRNEPTPTPVPAPPRLDPAPQGQPARAVRTEPSKPSAPPAPAPTTGVTQAVLKTTQSLPTETLVKAEAPAPHKEAAPPTGGYVSSGVLLRKSPGPEAAPKRSAPEAAPRSAADGGTPYVSSGTMIVSHHAAQPAPAVPTEALKRRVEAACGKAAHDIQVVARADNQVQVRFKTASAAEGDRLIPKLATLPELAPYQVSFEVHVDH